MSIILGINAFHADSAACLVIDGQLVAAVAEERLGKRLKHSPEFPVQAIRWVLAEAGVRLRDVTHLAIPRDGRANRLAKAKYVLSNPVSGAKAALEHVRRGRQTQGWVTRLAEVIDEDPFRVSFEVVEVEHHLAHIASAYYTSARDSLSAGLSYDASGDFGSSHNIYNFLYTRQCRS